MANLIVKLQELFAVYGIKVIAALAILILGRWVARAVQKLLERVMVRSNIDETLVRFACHLAYIALLAFFVLAALNQLGIQTTSFVAVLGAAGLAIGFALQGSLSNFAAGVLLIVFRPFKVGDFIEGGGVSGVVEEIQIFTTQLKSPDNKTIIIPNAKITGDNIVNYSAKDTRRVDLVIGVSYSDDLNKVKAVLESVLAADSRVLENPAPTIGVLELADNSVNLAVRPWTATANYWDVYFDLHKAIKERFDAEGISIPFPQRDLHVYQESSLTPIQKQ